MRTVWIAAFCLALLGGLFATKVTASMAPAEDIALDPTAASTARDTLTRSDKLDVGYFLPSGANGALPIESMDVLQIPSRMAAARGARGVKRPHANRIAVMLPKPRPRIRLSRNNDASKAAADLKSCAQPEGLGGLLLSWSGSLRCG